MILCLQSLGTTWRLKCPHSPGALPSDSNTDMASMRAVRLHGILSSCPAQVWIRSCPARAGDVHVETLVKKSLRLINNSLNYFSIFFSIFRSSHSDDIWTWTNSSPMGTKHPALKPGGGPGCSYRTNLLVFITKNVDRKWTASAKYFFLLEDGDKTKPRKEGWVIKTAV